MSGLYNTGSRKIRPGIYMRFTNRGTDSAIAATVVPWEPENPEPDTPTPDTPSSGYAWLADRTGVLLKTSDGFYLSVRNDATETMLLKDRSGMLLKTFDGFYLSVRN